MHSERARQMVIFTNTFPKGNGETFFADELPFLSEEFGHITIYPLFKANPANNSAEQPLLDFEDKDRWALLKNGLFKGPLFGKKRVPWFPARELWKCLSGRGIALREGEKRARLAKRLRIYLNYLLIFRAIIADRKKWEELVRICSLADVIYFYWGDKSLLVAPYLKKELAKISPTPPPICARFHGSDLYEGAKGYLPCREEIYGAVDFAATVSENGAKYIKEHYKVQPKKICTCYLGSIKKFENDVENNGIDVNAGRPKALKLISCSNVIELKRVGLIFDSIKTILENAELSSALEKTGYGKFEWIHFGSGNMLEQLKQRITEYVGKERTSIKNGFFYADDYRLTIKLMGQTAQEEIFETYSNIGEGVYILLSRSEGVPVSIMEALSYSLPIIATDVGGVSEIFDGEKKMGYLLKANPSTSEVAHALLDYAALSADEKADMSSAAYSLWESRWNGENNYKLFAQRLSAIARERFMSF